MLFTTLPYALFFVVAWAIHWALPPVARRPWLLLASYVFYMQTIPQYVLLIAALTLVNYGFGLVLGRPSWTLAQENGKNSGDTVETPGAKSNVMVLGATSQPETPGGIAPWLAKVALPGYFPVGVAPFPRPRSGGEPPQNPPSRVSVPFVGHSVPSVIPSSSRVRKALLIGAIGVNLAVLAFFKYVALGLDALWGVVRLVPHAAPEPVVAILLPLGISFFTFEFIHYAVEVYRGQPPMRNLCDFALFAAFFPTQIAGPIKRFPDFVKQLAHPVRLAEVRVDEGLNLIVRGMAKKIIIADTLAPLVAVGFGQPQRLGFLAAWCAIYAFAAQIYADFSGYTDIGRGCALLLGYAVPDNFANPYGARDPGEFWERWHISLSRWLRDYLYIPLGGSRCPLPRVCLNLLITMALGGLWHGASWHFMLWGVYQGALLIGQRLWERCPQAARLVLPAPARRGTNREKYASSARFLMRMRRLGGQIATFHLMCIGWVLFRAETPGAIGGMLLAAFTPWRDFGGGFALVPPAALGVPALVLAGAALALVLGWARDWLGNEGSGGRAPIGHSRPLGRVGGAIVALGWLRPVAIVALLVLVCVWPQGEAQRFIYFQF